MCYRSCKRVVEEAFPGGEEGRIYNKVLVVVQVKVKAAVKDAVNDYRDNLLHCNYNSPNKVKANALRSIVLSRLVLRQVDQVNSNDVNLVNSNSKVNCLDLL